MNRTRLFALGALLACASLTAAASATAATITMSGSTSIAPLATKLAKAFVNQPGNKGKVKFVILQGGSDIGITDVSRGRVTLGMSSRDPKPADPGGIVFNKIARDAVCVVTNPSNPIAEPQPAADPGHLLRPDPQLEPGRRRDGERADRPRRPYGRLRYAGRLPEHLHGPDPERRRQRDDRRRPTACRRRRSNPTRTRSATRPSSFTNGLHDVPYQGVPCTLRNAKSGQYAGVVTSTWSPAAGRPAIAKEFINFARTTPAAQKLRRERLGAAALVPAPGKGPTWRSLDDSRVERILGAVACLVLLIIAGMIVFVFVKAWPSFAAQRPRLVRRRRRRRPAARRHLQLARQSADYVYTLRAWPLLWGTFVVTAGAVLIGIVFSLFAAIFIVEFAPPRLEQGARAGRAAAGRRAVGHLRADRDPRASSPGSATHLISLERKESVANVVQLDGACIVVGIADPDRDDRADHDRDRGRRAARGPAQLDRGRARRSAPTAGG